MASFPPTPPLRDRSNNPPLPPTALSGGVKRADGCSTGLLQRCSRQKRTPGSTVSSDRICKLVDSATLTDFATGLSRQTQRPGKEASFSGPLATFCESSAEEDRGVEDAVEVISGNEKNALLRGNSSLIPGECSIPSSSIYKGDPATSNACIAEQEASSLTPLSMSSYLMASQSLENHTLISGKLRDYDRLGSLDKRELTRSCPPSGRLQKISKRGKVKREGDIHKLCGIPQNKDTVNNKGGPANAANASCRRRRSILAHSNSRSYLDNFLQVQRTHYAAVDAFDLEEEEAGSELE